MALTDVTVKGLKAESKPYRKSDRDGLYMLVRPTGVKSWLVKIYFRKPDSPTLSSKPVTLGTYPAMSLADARKASEQAKALSKQGLDPTQQKTTEKLKRVRESSTTFGDYVAKEVARLTETEWHDKTAKAYRSRLKHLYEHKIAAVALTDLTNPLLKDWLEGVGKKVAETGIKLRILVNNTLEAAVEEGLILFNPTPSGKRLPKGQTVNRPAVTDAKPLQALIKSIRTNDEIGDLGRMAMLTMAFLGQRPDETIKATWAEFDLTKGVWHLPAERRKGGNKTSFDQYVPIPKAFIAELKAWKKHVGGEYAFPNANGKPVSLEYIERLMREDLGYRDKHSPHGFRSSIKTTLITLGYSDEDAKRVIGHTVGNKTDQAYERLRGSKALLERQREMLERYYDHVNGVGE